MSAAGLSSGSPASCGAACVRFLPRGTRSARLANKLSKIETIALVGSETLLGREIGDICAPSHLPARLSLIASGADETGLLKEFEGEPTVLAPLDSEALGDTKSAFLAGSPDSTRTALALGLETPLIDLTYAGEESPHARLRAPMVEPARHSVPADAVHVIASPARPRGPRLRARPPRRYRHGIDPESPASAAPHSALGGACVRTRQRARQAGSRRAAAADRQPSFLQGTAQEHIRRAARLQRARPIR